MFFVKNMILAILIPLILSFFTLKTKPPKFKKIELNCA